MNTKEMEMFLLKNWEFTIWLSVKHRDAFEKYRNEYEKERE
jgi:hypothetical protein